MHIMSHSVTPSQSYDYIVGTSENSYSGNNITYDITVYGYRRNSSGNFVPYNAAGNVLAIGYVD